MKIDYALICVVIHLKRFILPVPAPTPLLGGGDRDNDDEV